VATSLGGETVFTLNQKRAQAFKRGAVSVEQVRQITAYEKPTGPVAVRSFGDLQRSGYRIEKLIYDSEPGIAVPALLFIPDGTGRRPGVVYVHGRGKAAGAAEIESLVRSGNVVLAIDARGLGETRAISDENGSDWPRYFGDFSSAMTILLSRGTLVGMRARDIVRGVDVLSQRDDVDRERIYGAAVEGGGIPLLHAAILDDRIRKVALDRTLVSYQAIVDHKIHKNVFENVIPGVLKTYDLPDLARLMSPRELRIIDATDPVGQRMAVESVQKLYTTSKISWRGVGDTAASLYGFGDRK
jgi:cephalosporin-C deacetylase-like acetyl esterase